MRWGGEKQRHSLKVLWEEGEEERTVRVEYGGWGKAWKVSASGRGKVDKREQERQRAESMGGGLAMGPKVEKWVV